MSAFSLPHPRVLVSTYLTAGSPPLPSVWKDRHCSSSDEDTDVDVEGLRRRRGREPGPPQPVIPVDVEDQAKGEGAGGELGISLNMCLLGTLVLLGLGILLFSGEEYSWLGPPLGPLAPPCCPGLSLPLPASPGASSDCFRLQVRFWSLRLVSRQRPWLAFCVGANGSLYGEWSSGKVFRVAYYFLVVDLVTCSG